MSNVYDLMYEAPSEHDVHLVWVDPATGARVFLAAEDAVHAAFCELANVKLVLNVNSQSDRAAQRERLGASPARVVYLPFHDAPPSEQETGFKRNAGKAVVELMDAIERGDNAVVHCRAGVHRSPAVVFAALARLGRFENRWEAYKHVAQRRRHVRMYEKLARWVDYASRDELRYRSEAVEGAR